MPKLDPRVSRDPSHGYFKVDPPPSEDELRAFYESRYYGLLRDGSRAPDLGRITPGGAAAERELAWLRSTQWTDIRAVLETHLGPDRPRRLLDVGAGTGHFAGFMLEADWECVAVEPATDAIDDEVVNRIRAYPTIEDCREAESEPFDAAVLLNVLEHVADPVRIVRSITPLLAPAGLLVIRVPNDFSELQESARAAMEVEPWWITLPDHVNYFDFDSLAALLADCGYEIVDRLGDFPMELFLLFGDDYIGNPEVGSRCHQKRVSFELALPEELRRTIYRNLALGGVGRNAQVFARKKT